MPIKPSVRFLKTTILLLVLAGIFSLAFSFLLPRMLDLNSYQTQLTELLQKQLNRSVRLGNSKFTWIVGPSFTFNDVYLQERGSNREFMSARSVSFRLALLPLLAKKIELREIIIDSARVTISRDEEGVLNIDDLLQPTSTAYDLHLKGIKIRNSTLFWRDQATGPTCTNLNISSINLSLDNLTRGKKCSFKLAAILEGNNPNSINTAGTIKIPKTGELLKNAVLHAKLDLNQLEHSQLWPYFGRFVPFGDPGGTTSLKLDIKGQWQNLQAKVTVLARNPKVIWPKVFHATVEPKQAQLAVELKWYPKTLDIHSVQLSLDGFAIKGTVKLNDLDGTDPIIHVKAVSETFDYTRVRSYIPFGIIAEDTADFIEHKIKTGIFKLDNGTLNSRFSQLARFGIGNNADTLYIKGTADQASIQYGAKAPRFQQIKGTLELKGRNFNLVEMSGNFGGSPFTMAGTIGEYATEGVPSPYPFSMTITPKPAEVAWLAEIAGVEALRFQGATTLKLQGDGPTSAYRLSGEWLLTPASYEYPAVVKKPAGMVNSLSFSALLGKDATRFTSFSYQLPPLKLSGSGLLRYAGETPFLSFDIESNQFRLDNHLPILTTLQEYQLLGGAQAHILGSGDPRSIGTMLFSGMVKLTGFSLKPHPKFAPVTAINSQINFKGNSLETSNMAIRYGSTPLAIKGRIASLQNPEAELFITSNELNPADFGVSATNKVPQIKQFSTNLAMRDGLLTIRNISGKLTKSSLSASGTIRTKDTPDISLKITSSYLDIDEVSSFFASFYPALPKNDSKPMPFKLQTHLTAEAGNYKGTNFTKLSTKLQNDEGVLKVNGLTAGIFGGQLTLHGQLAKPQGQAPLWNLSLVLERARSGELLHMLGVSRDLRGLATIQATLNARGDGLERIKQSANGVINLKIERGVLRKFKSLSKIISILNVSQLLTFSLPDMARDGMPFNEITSTIGVKDGVLSTQDFFIDSNVMHVTSVGKIDSVKETIDMLIGVQPLQTVDRVISRIPVVGWILSGGDGSMITTYFEIKGSLENPEVSAIPVKTMATGTLDIFRRVFELPVRLFTDTGEVILGNQKERPKAQ